ncbi:11328_t:CDS:2 [Diversispora eburnea]|uniref:11328_t:CDS:1 n=1 Tax=Diversispora eburnea TaxID=1213867 RepID=A0A9N8YWX0_9GLOM|nr:11328_t:CDS:2 [Diversispora eburnea]
MSETRFFAFYLSLCETRIIISVEISKRTRNPSTTLHSYNINKNKKSFTDEDEKNANKISIYHAPYQNFRSQNKSYASFKQQIPQSIPPPSESISNSQFTLSLPENVPDIQSLFQPSRETVQK